MVQVVPVRLIIVLFSCGFLLAVIVGIGALLFFLLRPKNPSQGFPLDPRDKGSSN